MDESINRKERRMKLSNILDFISDYSTSKIFKKGLEIHLAKLLNKERSEVYDKVMLFCPSLSTDDKKFIKDRIEKNKAMFDKRSLELEKLIKTKAYSGDFKDEVESISKLDEYLSNHEEHMTIQSSIANHLMFSQPIVRLDQPPLATVDSSWISHSDLRELEPQPALNLGSNANHFITLNRLRDRYDISIASAQDILNDYNNGRNGVFARVNHDFGLTSIFFTNGEFGVVPLQEETSIINLQDNIREGRVIVNNIGYNIYSFVNQIVRINSRGEIVERTRRIPS